MQTFRSEVIPDFFQEKIDYDSKILMIGSCFTENMGKMLGDLKLNVLINPFGILYNPVSIANSIQRIVNQDFFEDKELLLVNEKWISFYHHGRYSGTERVQVLENINRSISVSYEFLKCARYVFITFGTALVYKYLRTKQIVANCHKIPAKEFEYLFVSVEDIVEMYSSIIGQLKGQNPQIKIIFTVSPVRHWKDGAVKNQLSKSTLMVAIHKLIKNFENTFYFPSYEIVMDDLRDYRFYADDLFHPNQMAIDYIGEKFKNAFFSPKALQVAGEIEKLNKAMGHRPFYPQTNDYKKFVDSNLKLIEKLTKAYPELVLQNEMEYFLSERLKYFSRQSD